ncbi:MAG: hypothetical protein ABIO94_11705 [Opitutaceae bacterium]
MTILHLEDNPHDAELIAALLLGEWPDCVIEQVSTQKAFIERLGSRKYDVVLSDFNLQSFDGLQALHLAYPPTLAAGFLRRLFPPPSTKARGPGKRPC